MDERGWNRLGAVAGIAFVVLLAVSIGLVANAPMPDDSASKIGSWYFHHRHRAYLSAALGSLASAAFVFFLTHFRRVLLDRKPGEDRLAGGLVIAGATTVVVGMLGVVPLLALTVASSRTDPAPSDVVIRTLADVNYAFLPPLAIFLSVLLLMVGLALQTGAFGARPMGYVAYLGSVLALIGGVAGHYPDRNGQPPGLIILGIIATGLFLIVLLVVSIGMLTKEGAASD